ncbi:LAETG motif-containing sortase-dependent surface protein [Streptomyces sp. CB01373]|uniref:LAETG motif-containing sortase-dependent surface protein n=1 Tax=Streptomyces sp. CB01373 TaxID=2020325 RepID=UPI001F2FB3FE|nr:LAETG motif-containing sortase-dependent surface protein [Streptomyces sp. CB01373]
MALAAATAAIAPAVLLAAPAAFATGNDPVTSSESTPTDDTESTPSESTPTDDTESTPSESTPTEDAESTPSESTPSEDESATDSPKPTPSATVTSSPSASPTPDPELCKDTDDLKFDKNLHTSLSGLPSKIVAGSGFHNFKLNVKNSGKNAYKRVDLGVFAAQIDEKNFEFNTSYLTLQFKDPATGKWVDISLDERDEGAGYLGYTDVQAKESFSIDLRLSIGNKAPAGMGFAISIGMYADDKGNCVYSSDNDSYQFDVLAAGSKQGNPGDAKPQGGKKPLPVKPAGDNQIVPEGHLAETGSSSALPMIALAGGAAVAVGAGAVFVVRRRKAGSGAATA